MLNLLLMALCSHIAIESIATIMSDDWAIL